MKSYRVIRSIAPLGTVWRWVVNFTPRPLYPVPQNRSGGFGEEKSLLRSPLFWDSTQRRLVACCQYFRATCRYRNVGNKLRCVRSEKSEGERLKSRRKVTCPCRDSNRTTVQPLTQSRYRLMSLGIQTILYNFRKKNKVISWKIMNVDEKEL